MGWGHLAFGLLNYHNGRWLQAREHFDAAFEVLTTRCTDVSFELSTVSTMQLWTAYYLGEVGAFGQMCPRMLREARARGDLYTATNLCTGLPNLSWLVEDDVAGGRAALRVAMKHWSRQGFHLQHYWDMLARVNLEIYADNGDAAWRAVERDWRELSRSLLLRISMVRIEAFDARGRAALAAARGREDTGRLVTVAERTARALDKTRLEVGAALAALLRAGAASVRGAGDVGEQLAACEQRFAAADMRLHENVVRHQRGRLVGGDEGSGLVAAADAWFAEHGVARPARLCATFSPGVAGA
jgi:hypothetical protein